MYIYMYTYMYIHMYVYMFMYTYVCIYMNDSVFSKTRRNSSESVRCWLILDTNVQVGTKGTPDGK